MRKIICCLILGLFVFPGYSAAQKVMTVKANQPLAPIQSTMWGIFFEDINFAADGGIYAQLIKNGSFEFDVPLMGWKISNEKNGAVQIINRGQDYSANPRVGRITVHTDTGSFKMGNEGFRGIGIKQGVGYEFSMLARMSEGTAMPVTAALLNEKGETIGENKLIVSGTEWKKYSLVITAASASAKGSILISFNGKGIADLDMLSLFPVDTWKNRKSGLRADLVQLLADMKPGFIRFPGGCIVEGRDLENRYQWKKTVGDLTQRELIINRWNTEFKHRPAPDYFQSFGLGFYEYFQLAEDIGAAPLPILNCGMACQFNTAELVPVDQLDPYIQDAFDLIEFANGTPDTKWGKLRSDMGHPAPFNLTMIGVGNEQWGPQYVERYKVFAKAIHERYPGIKLVSSVGPFPGGELFNYLDKEMRSLHADILDEHYYMPPEFFLKNASRYDNYDRNGPRIFAGEYAAHVKGTEGAARNTWQAALAEAAFMTGLERNADLVHMSSYAPLFSHVDAWQWAPDLIWFDNIRAYGTPNYYVQKLFSVNKGTHVLPVSIDNQPVAGQDSVYATAALDKSTNELILKLVNVSADKKEQPLILQGVKIKPQKVRVLLLTAEHPGAINSIDSPLAVTPAEVIMEWKPGGRAKGSAVSLPPYSFQVLRFKLN